MSQSSLSRWYLTLTRYKHDASIKQIIYIHKYSKKYCAPTKAPTALLALFMLSPGIILRVRYITLQRIETKMLRMINCTDYGLIENTS
jgi:hypothetical protein